MKPDPRGFKARPEALGCQGCLQERPLEARRRWVECDSRSAGCESMPGAATHEEPKNIGHTYMLMPVFLAIVGSAALSCITSFRLLY